MRKRIARGTQPEDASGEILDFSDIDGAGDWILFPRTRRTSERSGTRWLNLKLVREGSFVGRCNYWLAYNIDSQALARNAEAGHLGRRTDLDGAQLLRDVSMACAEWLRENPQGVDLADIL